MAGDLFCGSRPRADIRASLHATVRGVKAKHSRGFTGRYFLGKLGKAIHS